MTGDGNAIKIISAFFISFLSDVAERNLVKCLFGKQDLFVLSVLISSTFD